MSSRFVSVERFQQSTKSLATFLNMDLIAIGLIEAPRNAHGLSLQALCKELCILYRWYQVLKTGDEEPCGGLCYGHRPKSESSGHFGYRGAEQQQHGEHRTGN